MDQSSKLTKVWDTESGYEMFVTENEVGGQTFITTECGVGVVYFDTAIHDPRIMRQILDYLAKG